jgi:peptidoglycan hydrolase CwlO-like protein
MPIRKIILFLCLLLAFFLPFFIFVPAASSDQLDEITKQLGDLNDSLNKSKAATQPLESQLKDMQNKIAGIKQQVSAVENDTASKKKEIDRGYKNLAEKEKMIEQTIRDFYVNSYYDSPLLIFFSARTASEITQSMAYQQANTQQEKAIITNLALTITDLEKKKAALEQEQQWLITTKANLDAQSAKLDNIIVGAKEYQAKLSNQIAQLSAQQQQLVAQKQASLNIPKSAYSGQGRSCVDDRGVSPGFSPALAFFTYGVPNRVGLNQYGALGRAQSGESAEQILQDYYPNYTLKKDYDQGATINVEGYGSFVVDEYVKRIYEMPDSWTDNDNAALKAQAVAARSYGLAHRNSICTTESCQVFKPEPKGGNWNNAVDATKGWVLVDGSGNPVSTQYSSTHGGYIINIPKFDGSGGNPASFAELNERAYDKMSPWFYCDWGSRPEYSKTAWLKPEEVADIVNVILLAKKDASLGEHFYQLDQPPSGKDVWSADRVKSELKSRGANPFSSVATVSVSADFGNGTVTTVSLSGDAGNVSFSGQEFKDWFNLRAPANIQIVGPLYNVETK